MKRKQMSVIVTLLLTVAVAYYIYTPLPDAIQEPWKLMLLDAGFRTVMHMVRLGLGFITFLCDCLQVSLH